MRSILVALLFLAFQPAALWGWGQTGHRTIAAIAQKHLQNSTKRKIARLLDDQSLVWVSTYMDEIKSDDRFDHTHEWHWVTIPDGKTYSETEKNPDGDLLTAICRTKETLANKDTSQTARAKALKFLVHLVGDLHQPLHVGNGEDRGGNDVKVEWFGSYSNLHRVWDSEMLQSRDFAYSELAQQLQRTITRQKSEQWSRGDVFDWAHENLNYRDQIYQIDNPDYMGYEYTYRNWDLLTHQLQKGGVRLAHMLNEVL
jgi:hypothetical protein